MKMLVPILIMIIGLLTGCQTPAVHLPTETFIGTWKGETDQGFPITLQVKDVDDKIRVTEVYFAKMISWKRKGHYPYEWDEDSGTRFQLLQYTSKPNARIKRAEFWFIDDKRSSTLIGIRAIFTGESSMTGDIHFEYESKPRALGRIRTLALFEFTATKQEKLEN